MAFSAARRCMRNCKRRAPESPVGKESEKAGSRFLRPRKKAKGEGPCWIALTATIPGFPGCLVCARDGCRNNRFATLGACRTGRAAREGADLEPPAWRAKSAPGNRVHKRAAAFTNKLGQRSDSPVDETLPAGPEKTAQSKRTDRPCGSEDSARIRAWRESERDHQGPLRGIGSTEESDKIFRRSVDRARKMIPLPPLQSLLERGTACAPRSPNAGVTTGQGQLTDFDAAALAHGRVRQRPDPGPSPCARPSRRAEARRDEANWARRGEARQALNARAPAPKGRSMSSASEEVTLLEELREAARRCRVDDPDSAFLAASGALSALREGCRGRCSKLPNTPFSADGRAETCPRLEAQPRCRRGAFGRIHRTDIRNRWPTRCYRHGAAQLIFGPAYRWPRPTSQPANGSASFFLTDDILENLRRHACRSALLLTGEMGANRAGDLFTTPAPC